MDTCDIIYPTEEQSLSSPPPFPRTMEQFLKYRRYRVDPDPPSGMPPVLLGFACLARKSSKHILPNGALMVMNPMVQPVKNGLQQIQGLLFHCYSNKWSATTPVVFEISLESREVLHHLHGE